MADQEESRITIQSVYDGVNSCGEHGVDIPGIENAETVVAVGGCGCYTWTPEGATCGSWCDSGSFGIGKLPDGSYCVLYEDSDSSGHGCQCGGSGEVFDTLSQALFSLTACQKEFYALYANS